MLSMNSDCNTRRKPQVTHSKTLRSESFRHIVPLVAPAACILNHEIANLPRSRDTCLVTVIIIISPIQGNDVPKTRRGLFARWSARKRQRLTSGHPGWCGLEMDLHTARKRPPREVLLRIERADPRGTRIERSKGEKREDRMSPPAF